MTWSRNGVFSDERYTPAVGGTYEKPRRSGGINRLHRIRYTFADCRLRMYRAMTNHAKPIASATVTEHAIQRDERQSVSMSSSSSSPEIPAIRTMRCVAFQTHSGGHSDDRETNEPRNQPPTHDAAPNTRTRRKEHSRMVHISTPQAKE
jgi:hypothetical protein